LEKNKQRGEKTDSPTDSFRAGEGEKEGKNDMQYCNLLGVNDLRLRNQVQSLGRGKLLFRGNLI